MPRPNRGRSMSGERNLAKRIAYERERRNLSYEALAKLMTDAGCAIQGSAIYRIEKGDPPRRVAYDEALALEEVFEVPLTDLSRPIELIEKEWAETVARDFIAASTALDDAYADVVRAAVGLGRITQKSAELREFVEHQWKSASPSRQWFGEFSGVVEAGQLASLAALAGSFWNQVLAVIDELSAGQEST